MFARNELEFKVADQTFGSTLVTLQYWHALDCNQATAKYLLELEVSTHLMLKKEIVEAMRSYADR